MKRVLVTGASKGIGAAIARRLGASGWKVAVHYSRDQRGAEAVGAELEGQLAGIYRADLSNKSEAVHLIDTVEADGALTALVNNAGVYLPSSFVDASDAEFESTWERTYSLNLLAPLLLSRRAAILSSGRGGGKILNVASRVGFKGEAGAAHYAATKAALINLTRSLAVELSGRKVGVFGIAPGWVETAMAREGMETRLAEILATLPLGRMGSPEDCAAAANFLLSDEAAYLSGQVIDLNGASYFH